MGKSNFKGKKEATGSHKSRHPVCTCCPPASSLPLPGKAPVATQGLDLHISVYLYACTTLSSQPSVCVCVCACATLSAQPSVCVCVCVCVSLHCLHPSTPTR